MAGLFSRAYAQESTSVFLSGQVVDRATEEPLVGVNVFLATLIFSSTDHARHCTLLNPEVLDFEYDAQTGVLQATANGSLHIRNEALGYQIILHDAFLIGTDHNHG